MPECRNQLFLGLALVLWLSVSAQGAKKAGRATGFDDGRVEGLVGMALLLV